MTTRGPIQLAQNFHYLMILYMKFNQNWPSQTGKCIRRFVGIYAYCRYLIDRKWLILVLTLYRKHAICLKDYRLLSFLSIQYVHGDLCKHLGIYSSTDHPDRYSNLFLNAYINRHMHAEYLKMIQFYSPLGIWHVFLYNININIYHFRSNCEVVTFSLVSWVRCGS